MDRFGERHDGDGVTVRAVRHIRGGKSASALLALDSARAADGALFYIQEGFADVAITSTLIKTLRATPQILVAAPGTGYFLEFLTARLMLDYATNVLSEPSACNLEVRYGTTTGVVASQTVECTGFLYQAADTYTNCLPKIDAIGATATLENLTLVLFNNGAAEFAGNAGGDCVLRVRTNYRIHQLLA